LLAPLARIALDLFSTELPKCGIGDACHGRKHYRRIDGEVSDDE
jgi:hypothetical protein